MRVESDLHLTYEYSKTQCNLQGSLTVGRDLHYKYANPLSGLRWWNSNLLTFEICLRVQTVKPD